MDTENRSTKPHLSATQPLVAIVGRPNVGKSSLFNAIVGRRAAIVSEVSGTTRDRLFEEVFYGNGSFLLADTGGVVPVPETDIEANVSAQVDLALEDADAVIFVTDVKYGLTHSDRYMADRLRRVKKPVVLVANKVDNRNQEALALEMYEAGLGTPISVSSLHRHGLDDLLDGIVAHFPSITLPEDQDQQQPRFTIVGRPNVGKSALANAILGTDRSIVSDVSGTTRDAFDTPFQFDGKRGVLVDTAGIRRRGAVQVGIEKYSVLRAARAVHRSDVALMVLDATEMVTDQDLHIAGLVMDSFKGVAIVVNKWDLVAGGSKDEKEARRVVLSRFRFIDHAPVICTSAMTGEGLAVLLRAAFAVEEQRKRWLVQSELNATVMDAVARHLPPKHGSRSMKIYRVKQETVSPPTFVFYCNNPNLMHFSYERYLENSIREAFGFEGNRLRLEFRGKGKIHVIGDGRRSGKSQNQQRNRRGSE